MRGGGDAGTAFFLPLLSCSGLWIYGFVWVPPPFFSRPGPDGPPKLSVGINANWNIWNTHVPMKQFSLGGSFGCGTEKGWREAATKLPKSVEQNSKIAQNTAISFGHPVRKRTN